MPEPKFSPKPVNITNALFDPDGNVAYVCAGEKIDIRRIRLFEAAPDMYNLLQEISDDLGYFKEYNGEDEVGTLGDTIKTLLTRVSGEV